LSGYELQITNGTNIKYYNSALVIFCDPFFGNKPVPKMSLLERFFQIECSYSFINFPNHKGNTIKLNHQDLV